MARLSGMIVGAVVIALLLPAAAMAVRPSADATVPSFEPVAYTVRLAGTNGYTIAITAGSEKADGQGAVTVSVKRPGAVADYTSDGTVTTSSIHADFGPLGHIDAVVVPSGRTKHVRITSCGTYTETFEPGEVEGAIVFRGEGGFSAATVSRAPLVSGAPFYGGFPFGSCSGWGESFSQGLPGARLKGVSYSGGRILVFQINKNRPKAQTHYAAALKERHGGMRIFREVRGLAGPGAFRFDHRLREATLAPPTPFAGSASTRRSPDTVSPLWSGDLTLDFPGHPSFPIVGPGVHVSLEHARRTPGDSSGVSF